jgi:anti-sigma factor RsiW
MTETKTPTCEHSDDLILFLYGEANDHEAAQFEKHLQVCAHCQNEISSFGQIRESIGIWKDAALGAFVEPQVIPPIKQKSALAALRSFFDLSPLWMKSAIGFATVLVCLSLALLLTKSGRQSPPQIAMSEPTFTQQQLDERVAQALKDQASQIASTNARQTQTVATAPSNSPNLPKPRASKQFNKSAEWAKVRRPLSKSEREQLAADLRLLSGKDEDTLNLLGDRINQEF